MIQYRDFIFQVLSHVIIESLYKGFLTKREHRGKVSDFEQTKKNFVCKDFEARDSSLNGNEGSFFLKSQRSSSLYYNDSRVRLKSWGTQGFLSVPWLRRRQIQDLADTFKCKLSPNYFPATRTLYNKFNKYNHLPNSFIRFEETNDRKKHKTDVIISNLAPARYELKIHYAKNRRNRWETISASSSKRGGSIRTPSPPPRLRDNSRWLRQVGGKAVSGEFSLGVANAGYGGALTLSKAHGIFSFQPRATTW